jgi:hypothetical protein
VPERPGVLQLGDFEMASRLSYFLTASTPDPELLDAAAAMKLSSVHGIEEQAARLLGLAKLKWGVESFHEQWLGLDALEGMNKEPAIYKGFSPALAAAMVAETKLFVSHVLVDGDGKLETLLTAPIGFVTPALAALYGVKSAGTATAPVKVDLRPAERAGLLTQASFLAIHANENQSSPIRRGAFVREHLLCQSLPEAPDAFAPPELRPGTTTRERFAQQTSDSACAPCHRLMNPIGFGLERYDGIGGFRSAENGRSIDDSGDLIEAADVSGAFKGGPDLATRLARSELVKSCVAQTWLRAAIARKEESADACTLATIQSAFASSGHDIRKLLLEIVGSDAFRYGWRTP